MKRPLALSAAALVLLSLVACASTDTAAGTGAGSDQASAKSSAARDPLTAYVLALSGSADGLDAQDSRAREHHLALGRQVASCMTDQGFEYIPVPYVPTKIAQQTDSLWDVDSPDWVTQYGYGQVVSPVGDEPVVEDEQGFEDPNAAYYQSLTSSEQAAHDEALYGSAVTGGSGETDGGCLGAAEEEMTSGDPTLSAEHAPILEAIDEFWQSEGGLPGVAEANVDWSACMSDRGYPGYTQQNDPRAEIAEAYALMMEEAPPTDAVTTGTPADDRFTALAAKERELALVDLDCREETDFRSRHDAASLVAQERFMADNRAALDALKSAAEQHLAR